MGDIRSRRWGCLFCLLVSLLTTSLSAEQTTILSPTAEPNPFSPNGDGTKDQVQFSFQSSHPWSLWELVIKDTNLLPVKSFSGMITNDNMAVSLTWDGKGEDGSGLEDGDYDYDINLYTDILPPISTIAFSREPYVADKCYIAGTTYISFSAQDFGKPVSGLQSIYWRMDPNWFVAYSEPFTIPTEIEAAVWFFGQDRAGNSEEIQAKVLAVDATPPNVDIFFNLPYYEIPGDRTIINSKTLVSIRSVDPSINGITSGVKNTEYKIGLTGGWQEVFSSMVLNEDDGEYTLFYRGTDNVGNAGPVKSAKIEIDNTSPEIFIVSPPANAMVNGSVKIIGSVGDKNFDHYRIEYFGPSGMGVVQKDTTSPVANDVLGIWDTFGLPVGYYSVIVTAWDKVGNSQAVALNLCFMDFDFVASWGSLNEMNKPMFICGDKAGYIYVSDENNKIVRKYSKNGNLLYNIVTGVIQPQGVAVDDAGNVYVAGHQELSKFNQYGNLIWTRTGFNQPEGIKISYVKAYAQNLLFVADRNNDRIVSYTLDGSRTTYEIKGGLDKPMDLAFDDEENVYIADSGNNRIAVFNLAGQFIRSFGSCCVGQGYLNNPSGISISSFSTSELESSTLLVYVSDCNNDKIKVFDKAGNQIYEFGGPGQGAGELNKSVGVFVSSGSTFDPRSSTIYVADRNNNRIQVFGSPARDSSSLPNFSGANRQSPVEIKNSITYPNPFSPNGDGVSDQAKIRYELSEDAEVTVKIYNQIGKLVYAFDKMAPGFVGSKTGINEISWGGINNAGKKVNNGVYYYFIVAKGSSGQAVTASGTLVVLK